MSEIDAAITFMEEALMIQRMRLGSTDRMVLATEERLALLRSIDRPEPGDDGESQQT